MMDQFTKLFEDTNMDYSIIPPDTSADPAATTRVTLQAIEYLFKSPVDQGLLDYILKPSSISKVIDSGQLSIPSNDGDHPELRFLWNNPKEPANQVQLWLHEFIQLVSSALPKMGTPYIMRLVMDITHRSLVLLQSDPTKPNIPPAVIGGICYRPFPEQGFTEIVFMAVMTHNQVKGYGRMLMEQLKEKHLKMGVMHLLTYGDQNALGFFQKQGFKKKIELAKERYHGYIKEYKGATLLECKLNPLITYSNITAKLAYQRRIIETLIQPKIAELEALAPKSITYTGTDRIIPLSFVKSAFPACNFDQNLADFEDHSVNLMSKLAKVVELLGRFKEGKFWRDPDGLQAIPGLPVPIDLEEINERVGRGYYTNVWIFHADVKRMLACLHQKEKSKWQESEEEETAKDREDLKNLEKLYGDKMSQLGLVTLVKKEPTGSITKKRRGRGD